MSIIPKQNLVGYWPLDGHALDMSIKTLFNDANLIAYYRCDNVNDSKGSNTLTNNNSVAFNAGKFGNGADFGSGNTNKSLKISTNLGIAGDSALSYSFWWKLPADITSGLFYPIGHRSTTSVDRYMQVEYAYNGGTRRIQVNASGGPAMTYNVALGTSWNHIVLTRAAGASPALVLYLNGVQVQTGTGGSATAAGNLFAIGTESGAAFADGIIDDVGVFNKVLSATEVGILYNSGTELLSSVTSNQNNGTVTGALPVPSQNPAIPASLAYKFNGSSDHISFSST